MKTKNVSQIKLTDSQLKSVREYCKLNNIEDVDKFITKCYTEGFNIKKYGMIGDDTTPTIIETEVIKEVIKEIPVEVIKYIDREVIKEVIVEVPVHSVEEKIVEVEKPNDKSKLLQETLQKLRKELSLKNTRIEELEKTNKQLESVRIEQGAVFLKGSNINETM